MLLSSAQWLLNATLCPLKASPIKSLNSSRLKSEAVFVFDPYRVNLQCYLEHLSQTSIEAITWVS